MQNKMGEVIKDDKRVKVIEDKIEITREIVEIFDAEEYQRLITSKKQVIEAMKEQLKGEEDMITQFCAVEKEVAEIRKKQIEEMKLAREEALKAEVEETKIEETTE